MLYRPASANERLMAFLAVEALRRDPRATSSFDVGAAPIPVDRADLE